MWQETAGSPNSRHRATETQVGRPLPVGKLSGQESLGIVGRMAGPAPTPGATRLWQD